VQYGYIYKNTLTSYGNLTFSNLKTKDVPESRVLLDLAHFWLSICPQNMCEQTHTHTHTHTYRCCYNRLLVYGAGLDVLYVRRESSRESLRQL